MAQAKVTNTRGKLTPNGYEYRFRLRLGEKGTGKVIASCTYWPWSEKSIDSAEQYIVDAAKRAGITFDW